MIHSFNLKKIKDFFEFFNTDRPFYRHCSLSYAKKCLNKSARLLFLRSKKLSIKNKSKRAKNRMGWGALFRNQRTLKLQSLFAESFEIMHRAPLQFANNILPSKSREKYTFSHLKCSGVKDKQRLNSPCHLKKTNPNNSIF